MSCMKLCWSNSSRLSVSFCLLLSLTYSRVSYHVFQCSRVGTGELEEPENLPKLVHLVDVPRFDDAHLQVQDKQVRTKWGTSTGGIRRSRVFCRPVCLEVFLFSTANLLSHTYSSC
ncbi:hypothetical protein KC19_8G056400 [Ceratodon purpureus]|uniref:Secreted protein n=1 Tax=Ceratodon purpureus TaxID=3225 RepID=A0A8T0H060_CERPU|nr:hypothetical protein KC19_8G056400 [Ceratodon purpureus]